MFVLETLSFGFVCMLHLVLIEPPYCQTPEDDCSPSNTPYLHNNIEIHIILVSKNTTFMWCHNMWPPESVFYFVTGLKLILEMSNFFGTFIWNDLGGAWVCPHFYLSSTYHTVWLLKSCLSVLQETVRSLVYCIEKLALVIYRDMTPKVKSLYKTIR